MITITASDILARFPEIDPHEVCLCDLDNTEFVTGGRITEIFRDCGYDESGEKCVNDQRSWSLTIHEWAHTMGL